MKHTHTHTIPNMVLDTNSVYYVRWQQHKNMPNHIKTEPSHQMSENIILWNLVPGKERLSWKQINNPSKKRDNNLKRAMVPTT